MANYSLQIEPTNDNVYKSLQENTLGNNKWINKCLNILLTMDNSIISFDADWGNGKTFFAKQLQMIINEKFRINFEEKSNSMFDDIKDLDFKNIVNNSYYAIYYNAWEYDNENNPVSSFLFYLLKILNKKIKSSNFNKIAINFITNVIEKVSCGWVKFSTNGEKGSIEKALSYVIETENIREEIKKLLNELKKEKFNNLIIFIDELDRCRPTYALKIIEMIKHYLKMENILIVCMTDVKQLSNCIKSIYGADYDSNMYLDKIFDFKFTIPSVKFNKLNYVKMKIMSSVNEDCFFDMTCMEVIDHFNLSLRSVDKYLGYIKKMFELTKKNTSYMDCSAGYFVECLFIPYYICVMLFKPYLYENFIKCNFEEFFEFCKREKIFSRIKKIYANSLYNEYDEGKIFDYLKNDCKLLVRQIKGENELRERYYINNQSKYGLPSSVNYFIKNIDMINFFIENTK